MAAYDLDDSSAILVGREVSATGGTAAEAAFWARIRGGTLTATGRTATATVETPTARTAIATMGTATAGSRPVLKKKWKVARTQDSTGPKMPF